MKYSNGQVSDMDSALKSASCALRNLLQAMQRASTHAYLILFIVEPFQVLGQKGIERAF